MKVIPTEKKSPKDMENPKPSLVVRKYNQKNKNGRMDYTAYFYLTISTK